MAISFAEQAARHVVKAWYGDILYDKPMPAEYLEDRVLDREAVQNLADTDAIWIMEQEGRRVVIPGPNF